MPRTTKIIPYSVGFLKFYTEWRRKESKQDAMRAWVALGLDSMAHEIAQAAKQQTMAVYLAREMRHVPLPATWLRGCGWENELLSPSQERAKKSKERHDKSMERFRKTGKTWEPFCS